MSVGFDFKRRLGAGQFGEVWLVNDKALDAERALKTILPSNMPDKTNFFKEAQLLKEVEHHNIVKVFEAGKLPDNRIYVSMEFLPKGSVYDEARGNFVHLTRAKRIMVDVLRGLEQAHLKNVLHRDIKPANILIGNEDQGKLSDFGLAVKAKKGIFTYSAKEYLYTIHLAPEFFSTGIFTALTDIYAAGVTFYRLINGDVFLPSLDYNELKKRVIKGQYINKKAYRIFVPLSIRRFINKVIESNPQKRFQSSIKMRRALEKINIVRNWNETSFENRTVCTSCKKNKMIRITMGINIKKECYVTIEHGSTKKNLRKIRNMCRKGMNIKQSQRFCAKILQDSVLGKIWNN